MNLILASNSPRRKQILKDYNFNFTVMPSNFEELVCQPTPEQTVKDFAFGKANDVFKKLPDSQKEKSVVLGADTIVYFNGKILGKPKDKEEAIEMLKALSGKEHFVYTGYCIITKGKIINQAVKSSVIFNDLSNQLILEYVATGKPLDKAGGYGIQDGFSLVKEYKGSFTNIVGLPIEHFNQTLKILLEEG